MACGGGCCGSSKSEEPTQKNQSRTSELEVLSEEELCRPPAGPSEACCETVPTSQPESSEAATNVLQPAAPEADCKDACCSTIVAEPAQGQSLSGSCCASKSTVLPTGAQSISSCCATENESVKCDEKPRKPPISSCAASCCDSDDDTCANETVAKASCCTTGNNSGAKGDCCTGNSTSQACATRDEKKTAVDTIEMLPSSSSIGDLEKGSKEREHIILSISGMTCSGCETKLKRVLGALSYIGNLKTSLVLARAEFDIMNGASNAEDVIKYLQRTTEFKCERISSEGSSLDLLYTSDPTALIKGECPDGILEIRRVDREVLRVDYDAKTVGARELLEQEWCRGLRLAPPRADPSLEAGSRHVWHMGFMTVLSAILTIPVLVMAWAPLPEREIAYGSASLALATIVQVVIAGPFYPKAIKALVFSKVIEMDLLIVLSTSAAYIFSVVSFGYLVAGTPLSTGEFFETSTLLVTLIMVGRFVASLARQKAAESISIRSLQTPSAILVEKDGKETEIDARLLQYGDVFKVAPDSNIPTDGTVMTGSSEVDESMLTGESLPVEKQPGATLIAGSINGSGMLTARLTRLPGDNTITTIACMVDEAKLSKPKIQDIADKVASYFVPVVVALTIITFVIWVAVGVAVRKQSGSQAVIEAITYAITVLIVSCPCAIGLAVPMVIVVASGVAARRGVIFRSAGSIEEAYKVTDVIFDKTGTLTAGKMTVVDEEYFNSDKNLTKSLLLGMLTNIKHPVSVAVATHLSTLGTSASTVQDAKALPGKGVEARYGKKVLCAGNSRWLEVARHSKVKAMVSRGLTTFCLTIDESLVAVLGLQDTLRNEAESVVSQLQQRGLNTHIISGDDDGAVQAIASQLNIPTSNVRSRCSPRDKQVYIQELLASPATSHKTKKQRKPVVMFVGDGTNDAVALAQATIGVHMSTGTDIAQSAADIVLARPNLSGVLTIINVSKKAIHRVAFNFGWSFVYNLFAVLLGAGAFVHARIPPEYAGLGELVSVLPVILAAVLLRWSRI